MTLIDLVASYDSKEALVDDFDANGKIAFVYALLLAQLEKIDLYGDIMRLGGY